MDRKRFRTYGRELMMLKEKGMFRKCYPKGYDFWTVCWSIVVGYLIVITITIGSIAKNASFFGAVMLVAFVITLQTIMHFMCFVAIPVLVARKSILLPAYRQHKLALAQAEFNRALQDFNAGFPSAHYRVANPADDTPRSMERLREYAENNRLSAELSSRFTRVEAAWEKLEDAEHGASLVQEKYRVTS